MSVSVKSFCHIYVKFFRGMFFCGKSVLRAYFSNSSIKYALEFACFPEKSVTVSLT